MQLTKNCYYILHNQIVKVIDIYEKKGHEYVTFICKNQPTIDKLKINFNNLHSFDADSIIDLDFKKIEEDAKKLDECKDIINKLLEKYRPFKVYFEPSLICLFTSNGVKMLKIDYTEYLYIDPYRKFFNERLIKLIEQNIYKQR